MSRFFSLFLLCFVVLAFSSCAKRAKSDADLDVGVVISIVERELYIYQDGENVMSYPVAVGQPSHPTPTGNFEIYRIDWNPDWTPPDSEWTEGAAYTPPGHEANPMGRVRIVYLPPYTIHGTRELWSLGKAASHGSVRMANEDVIELGRLLMRIGGAVKPEGWYEEVLARPDSMVKVELPEPVPLTNLQSISDWESPN